MNGQQKRLVGVHAEMVRGMAFAKHWRLHRHPSYNTPPVCVRCDGLKLVWWCGKPGQGGRRGPCPRCQVEASKRFLTQLAGELFA